jgi:hypothetical protein
VVRNALDSGTLSWKVGPADSRPIRILLYLAEGGFGGALLFVAVDAGRRVVADPVAGDPWLLGVVGVFAVLLVRWGWFLLWQRGTIRREDDSRLWTTHEWLEVYRWPRVAAAVVLVGAGLVAVDSSVSGCNDANTPIWYGTMVVALACALLAGLLCSKGELDAESLTLIAFRYGEWREVDLRTLTVAKPVRVGPYAFVWLSVSPGVEKRTATQGFYAIPTDCLDRAWPAFEAGLAADPPIDDETVERGRFFRRVNRFVAGGFLVLGLGILVGLAWLGGLGPQLLMGVVALAGFGLFLLKLAA